MKKILSFLFTFVLILIVHKASAEVIPQIPPETIVLKLEDNSCTEWKESAYNVQAKVGKVEWISCDQTKKCTGLICIQYIGLIDYQEKVNYSVEKAVDLIFDRHSSSYPPNSVRCQIIEKNQNDILYEWTLDEECKGTFPKYEISRAFFTEHGFHRVGYTCDNSEITPDQRAEWIKLLKDSVSIVAFEEAANINGLSMKKKLKDIDLGALFGQWQVQFNIPHINGRIHIARTQDPSPNGMDGAFEILIFPNFNADSLDKLFKFGNGLFQNKCKEKIKFNILQKSPSEIIYSYSHRFDPPNNKITLNAVVRSIFTGQDHYLFVYKRAMNGKLKQKDILYWKGQLEKIKLCNET